jgi:HAD superfamily hydrolase (TIGR01490 family)
LKRAAFFDLEKTLTPHAVEQTCALEFRRQGQLEWSSLLRVLGIYVKYNLGLVENFDDMKRFGARIFTGRELAPIVERARKFHQEKLSRELHPHALTLVEQLKKDGVPIYLVSSTYRFLVDPYAEQLGAAGVFAVDLELEGGRCTGEIVGRIPHGEAKAACVREVAARDNLELKECLAFGDSIGDLPMLEAVGRPHAVNPGRKLRKISTVRQWTILDW